MYIILVYDITTGTKKGKSRLPKILKLCRTYLHHTQKSVVEGEITESNLKSLKHHINKIIDKINDYVVIYQVDNTKNLKRSCLGQDYNPTDDII